MVHAGSAERATFGAPMATLYEELRSAPTASDDELRRAYRTRVRQLHPDLHRDRAEDEQAQADVALRRLNRAWDVLGDPVQRARYDASIGLGSVNGRHRQPGYTQGHRGRWRSPIVLIGAVAVAVGLIVVTAYAGTPLGRPATTVPSTILSPVGRCLTPDGPTDAFTTCGTDGDRVVAETLDGATCPGGSVAHAVRGRPMIVCLAKSTTTTIGQQ